MMFCYVPVMISRHTKGEQRKTDLQALYTGKTQK